MTFKLSVIYPNDMIYMHYNCYVDQFFNYSKFFLKLFMKC